MNEEQLFKEVERLIPEYEQSFSCGSDEELEEKQRELVGAFNALLMCVKQPPYEVLPYLISLKKIGCQSLTYKHIYQLLS